MTLIQTKQKRAGREQRNKYKPRTETSTKQEQKQEQHLTIRHAGRPADVLKGSSRGCLNRTRTNGPRVCCRVSKVSG